MRERKQRLAKDEVYAKRFAAGHEIEENNNNNNMTSPIIQHPVAPDNEAVANAEGDDNEGEGARPGGDDASVAAENHQHIISISPEIIAAMEDDKWTISVLSLSQLDHQQSPTRHSPPLPANLQRGVVFPMSSPPVSMPTAATTEKTTVTPSPFNCSQQHGDARSVHPPPRHHVAGIPVAAAAAAPITLEKSPTPSPPLRPSSDDDVTAAAGTSPAGGLKTTGLDPIAKKLFNLHKNVPWKFFCQESNTTKFKGTNDELLAKYGFDAHTAQRLAQQTGYSAGEIAGLSRTIELPLPSSSPQEGQGSVTVYTPEECDRIQKVLCDSFELCYTTPPPMCNGLNGKQCTNPASALVKPDEPGPKGANPPTHCNDCARMMETLNSEVVWLFDLAGCDCGDSPYSSCVDCEKCRRSLPCVECKNPNPDGGVHPGLLRCQVCLRSYLRCSKDNGELCIRCHKPLLHNRLTRSSGTYGICGRTNECTEKCAFHDDDDIWCMVDCGGHNLKSYSAYCPMHARERKNLANKEYRKRKRSGETNKSWTPVEIQYLTKLVGMEENKHKRGTHAGYTDWNKVHGEFEKKYSRFTKDQARDKWKQMTKGKKNHNKDDDDEDNNSSK